MTKHPLFGGCASCNDDIRLLQPGFMPIFLCYPSAYGVSSLFSNRYGFMISRIGYGFMISSRIGGDSSSYGCAIVVEISADIIVCYRGPKGELYPERCSGLGGNFDRITNPNFAIRCITQCLKRQYIHRHLLTEIQKESPKPRNASNHHPSPKIP
jgi:hypothetical protein